MPIGVIVIVSPKPGKESRVADLVAGVVKNVQESEPDVSEYRTYRTAGDEEGTEDYVVYMSIKNAEALAKRRELQHHQDIARFIKDEDLLRRPMRYMKLDELSGFRR